MNVSSSTRDRSARDRILDAACQLFYREGIRAVGVDTIVQRAGVAKMTLYNHFKSKDELVAAYLERRDAEVRRWVVERVEKRAATPLERLLALFDVFAERVELDDFRGCHLINAYVELAAHEHPAGELARANNRLWRDYILELAREAGIADAEELAHRLFLILEGAFVTAVMDRTPEPMRRARRTAEALLAAEPSYAPRRSTDGTGGAYASR